MDRRLDRQLYERWSKGDMPDGCSHAVTVGIMPPKPLNVDRWNAETRADRERVVFDLFGRLDRTFYGRRHEKRPWESKFDFWIRTETKNKFGTTIPAHLHGYLSIPAELMDQFYAEWAMIDMKVENFAASLGFNPDIMMQEFYTGATSNEVYSMKRIEIDAGEIWTRKTIKRRS